MITMSRDFEENTEWNEGTPAHMPDRKVWLRGVYKPTGAVRYCISSWSTWGECMNSDYEITHWAYISYPGTW